MPDPTPSRNRELPLSRRLRSETRVVHRLVESTKIAKAFFSGRLDVPAYCGVLARLLPAYEALERSLHEASGDPALGQFYLPHVFRARRIRRDLAHFGQPSSVASTASHTYACRITSLSADPALRIRLIAHAYVRFMADVSGGVIASRIAQRVLKLSNRDGLTYLSFEGIDPSAFRTDFRARLDGCKLPKLDEDAIVDEARVTFALNRAIADECWGALGTKAAR